MYKPDTVFAANNAPVVAETSAGVGVVERAVMRCGMSGLNQTGESIDA
jgi:hypothetical protein